MFKRQFKKLIPESEQPLFAELKKLVEKGKVYPAFRVDELHFYHAGGLLFRFTGASFKRSLAYLKHYDESSKIKYAKTKGYCTEKRFRELAGLSFVKDIGRFLDENQNRFQKGSDSLERRALSEFCSKTFTTDNNVIVLDIEVNLNTELDDKTQAKKPDLLLLKKDTHQLMFVEGKLSSHDDVTGNDGKSGLPKVHNQLCCYNRLIEAIGGDAIAAEYLNYIRLLKNHFGFNYECSELRVIPETKLLVLDHGGCSANQKQHVIESFGENVIWLEGDVTQAPLDVIWEVSGVKSI